MRKDIHPEYRLVVFEDTGASARFLTRSSVATTETTEHEGETYPLYKVDISSASHPFFTGKMKIVDTAGRVERFERRYGRRKRAGADAEAPADSTEAPADSTEAPADS